MQRHQFCSPSEAFDPVETRLTNNVNPVITTNKFNKWSKEYVLAFKVRRTIQWFAYRSGYGLQMLSPAGECGLQAGARHNSKFSDTHQIPRIFQAVELTKLVVVFSRQHVVETATGLPRGFRRGRQMLEFGHPKWRVDTRKTPG